MPKRAKEIDVRQKTDNAINLSQIIEFIETEVAKTTPGCRKYLLYQVGGNHLLFSINYSCPTGEAQQMERVMLQIAENFGLTIKTGGMSDSFLPPAVKGLLRLLTS